MQKAKPNYQPNSIRYYSSRRLYSSSHPHPHDHSSIPVNHRTYFPNPPKSKLKSLESLSPTLQRNKLLSDTNKIRNEQSTQKGYWMRVVGGRG